MSAWDRPFERSGLRVVPSQTPPPPLVLPPAPPFPVDVLPPTLRDFCVRTAASMSIPVEMVAVAMLVAIGGTAGNRVAIRVKAGWEELPVLWVAIVAPPGSMKTAAIKAGVRGIQHLQRRANQAYDVEVEQFERDHKAWKATKDNAADEPQPPHLRHYWTSSTTMEAIFTHLQHSNGIVGINDEILQFFNSLGQFKSGRGGDRQTALSLHDGQDAKIDRQSRPSLTIHHPAFGLIGGVQNARAHELIADDGQTERIRFVVPDVVASNWTDEEVPDSFGEAVDAFFVELDRIPPMDRHPSRAPLSAPAREVFRHWFDTNADVIRGSQGYEASFAAKWAGFTARLTLILHLAWCTADGFRVTSPVQKERVIDAIELAEWFRAHLHRALPLLRATGSAQTGGKATRVLRHIAKANGGWVARSKLIAGLGNIPTSELTEILNDLHRERKVESRIVPVTTQDGHARRSQEEWRAFPEAPPAPHVDEVDL